MSDATISTTKGRLGKFDCLRRAGMLSLGMRKNPYEAFRGLDDDLWYWMLTGGSRRFGILRTTLPGFPDEKTQSDYVGLAGEAALAEAYQFYRVIRRATEKYGRPLARESRVLDFGSGWGRIIRFFLKDVPGSNLLGIDVSPTSIEICRKLLPTCRFEQIPALPPTDLQPGFDLIYLYSVFSHLSEQATDAWISEFQRLLKPGGIVVVTTRPRGFITQCEEYRNGKASGYEAMLRSFQPADEWLSRFDRGEYCYAGTGGGENRSGDFYGEACIPREYAESHWGGRFQIRDYIPHAEAQLPQNVFVLQKP